MSDISDEQLKEWLGGWSIPLSRVREVCEAYHRERSRSQGHKQWPTCQLCGWSLGMFHMCMNSECDDYKCERKRA